MKTISKKMHGLQLQISLVDRCLLLYLALLLLYMIVNLFIKTDSQDTNTIDIIIRTSAAVIIGYFLSGNFSKTSNDKKQKRNKVIQENDPLVPSSQSEEQIKNVIGFQIPSEQEITKKGMIQVMEEEIMEEEGSCNHIQVIIVACIGGISLLLLFIARNYVENNPEISATVSQFRDFVSACVGYLVSCGKQQK